MCFSAAWSASSFWIMFITATIAVIKRMDPRIAATLYFFSMKEAIQYFLYPNIYSCNRLNQALSMLSWIHISFHPFFVLLFIQAFSRQPEFYNIPLGLSLVFAVFNIIRINPAVIKVPCKVSTSPISLCQETTCTYPGKHHLAYGFRLKSADTYDAYTPNMFTYMLLMFGVPLLIGDWPIPLLNIIVATIPYAIIAPNNLGEASAIWCMFAFTFVGFVYWSLLTGRKYYP